MASPESESIEVQPSAAPPEPEVRRVCLHGVSLEIASAVPELADELDRLFKVFSLRGLPEGYITRGVLRPYVQDQVLRHLSPHARRLEPADPGLELFHDQERFWLLDERWGLAELNLLRGRWRSWILPHASDPVRTVERAVLWPMAQLLRHRGLHLVPAAAVAQERWGALLLGAQGLGAELAELLKAGYRLIGQRWTALRCPTQGPVELLHLPGAVEEPAAPARRAKVAPAAGQWVDLNAVFPGARQGHAFCDVVLLIEPARRGGAGVSELARAEAASMLQQGWPIVELHPTRRSSLLPQRLGQECRCFRVRLTGGGGELPELMESIRQATLAPPPRLSLWIPAASPARSLASPAA